MSLALDLPVAAPAFRVVPAPTCVPPYDDEPSAPPRLRLVAPPLEPFVVDETVWFTEDRTPTAELPDPTAFTAVLLQALVEVLQGARSLSQLRVQTSVELYAELAERLQGGSLRKGGRPDGRRVGRVHAQARPEGVVEACATVRISGRLAAVALRLEGFGGRWVCTDLEGL